MGAGLIWDKDDEGAGAGAATTEAGTGASTIEAGTGDATQEAGAGASTVAAGVATDAAPAPKPKDWKDERLAQKTAQLAAVRAELAAAQAKAAGEKSLDPVADFDARVNEAATRQAAALAARASFNDKCNAAAQAGRTAFGEKAFNESLAELVGLVDLTDPQAQLGYNEFLASALETGEAPKIIFELGRDPEQAMKILAMSPRKMTIELAKLAGAGKVANVSSAPRPITPIESRGGRHEQIAASDPEKADNLSTPDWMARREAEVAARVKVY